MKKISLIMGIVLVVGLVGSFMTFQTGTITIPVEETRTFNTDEIKSLDILANNNKVNISPTHEDEIIVTMVGHKVRNATVNLTTEVSDSELKIALNENQIGWVNMNFIPTSVTLNIYLPEQIFESLNVNSRNGSIVIEDILVDQIDINGTNGSINVNNHGGSLAINTTNGRISLNEISGEINARTTNGQIQFDGSRMNQKVKFQTTNGAINVHINEEPENATFILSTTNGSTRIFGESTSHKVFGDGENIIELKTTNGSINVNK